MTTTEWASTDEALDCITYEARSLIRELEVAPAFSFLASADLRIEEDLAVCTFQMEAVRAFLIGNQGADRTLIAGECVAYAGRHTAGSERYESARRFLHERGAAEALPWTRLAHCARWLSAYLTAQQWVENAQGFGRVTDLAEAITDDDWSEIQRGIGA